MAKRTKYFSASSFSGKDRGDNRGQSPGRRGPDAAKRAPVSTGNVDTSTLTQDEIDEIR